MFWDDFLGHDGIIDRFRKSLGSGRIASSFLFVGPKGVGKRTFAMRLAQCLLCENHREDELSACGECPACLQLLAGSHPDFGLLSRPDDKNYIPVELLIGDREHRMRTGLCHDIALKSFCGGRKIAVIDDADDLNQEGANCLLKTLEEPPPGSMIILIGTSLQRQLPTIRSRCQIVRFEPLSHDAVARILMDHHDVDDEQTAHKLAALSRGSLAQAVSYLDEERIAFRDDLFSQLAGFDPLQHDFAKTINAFVDASGKDFSKKRQRMIDVANMATEFYRGVLRGLIAGRATDDVVTVASIKTAFQNWPGTTESATLCIDRCIDAVGQASANANQATWIECFLSDLGKLSRGVYVEPLVRF